MTLSYSAAVKAAQTQASAANLSLVFEVSNKPRYCTDGQRLVVPQPLITWDRMELVGWLDGLNHEIGHNMPALRDCFALTKAPTYLSTKSLTGILTNLVEDMRNDNLRTTVYPGTLQGHCEHMSHLIHRNTSSIPLNSAENRIISTMMHFDLDQRNKWYPQRYKIDVETLWQSRADNEMQAWLTKLRAEYGNAYSTATARASFELVKELLSKVFNYQDKAQEQHEQQQKVSKGKKSDSEKTSQNESDGEGAQQFFAPDTESVLFDPSQDKHTSKRLSGGKTHYDTVDPKAYYQALPEFNVVNLKYSLPCREINTYREWFQLPMDEVTNTNLGNRARQYLQAKTITRNQFNLEKGRIDSNKLYKLLVPRDKPLVYKQKTVSDKLDTAVSILMDNSGSMCREVVGTQMNKRTIALAACYALSKMCETLHIKNEIALFSCDGSANYHMLLKEFSDRLPTTDQCIDRAIRAYQVCSSGNADGENIDCAARRLLDVPAKRRILIVLSDGQPTGYGLGNPDGYLKRIVQSVESSRIIEIVGLGILDQDVKQFYSHYRVLNNLKLLPNELLNLLKELILK